jgi:hypothetical protein
MTDDEEIKQVGILPTFRDLFPQLGAVGEKYAIKKIKSLYLRDCLFILSKLSRHYVKYCQMTYDKSHEGVYRQRCLELLSVDLKERLFKEELRLKREFDIIFPELSVSHLIKLCLKHCDRSSCTKGEFEPKTLESVGECILIINSVMTDIQKSGQGSDGAKLENLVVNFTKQLIVDENFHILQKLYQNYFLFNDYLPKYKEIFDIEKTFLEKFKISVKEYFAFLFLVYSQFVITNASEEDWQMPYFDFDKGLSNLKPKFKEHLINNLLINNINPKKIDNSFYNMNDLTKRPFVKLEDGVVIPLSLKRLFIGLTDSVYFDILDFLSEEAQKKSFANAFGHAVEDYVKDIVLSIDKNAISEFSYGKDAKKTTDIASIQKDGVIFFECKKRQFHNLDFLQNGNPPLFYERLKEFCYKPLKQICDRISDFRAGQYALTDVAKEALIYPVIVSPLAPPLLSGAWDKLNLDQQILPSHYQTDKHIAHPEFIDLAELECIEACLATNTATTFVDLIKIKRADQSHHNANWMVILQKNSMDLQNKRLAEKYLEELKDFRDLLFDKV